MNDQKQVDKHLVEAVKKGDKSAFRKIFDKYYQILLATAINLLGDVNAAKDAVQEVFFELWKKREQINIHSSLEAFLKRSVINRSINIINKRKRIASIDNISEAKNQGPTADQLVEAKDLQKVINKAMEKLPDKCRLVFTMRRLENLPVKVIAEKLDISTKTVENQITKALKIMKNELQPYIQQKKKIE